MRLRIGIATLVACGLFAGLAVAGGTKVPNGDFERGNLSGWKTDQDGPGRWRILDKNGLPNASDRGVEGPKPIRGKFSAITFQREISNQFIYRTLKLDPDLKNTLKFKYRYLNIAEDFVSPNTFDVVNRDNQQFRVDVMKADSPLESTKGSDVLRQVVRTRAGDDRRVGKTSVSVNLSSLAETKVRVRFAVAVTRSGLFATIDDVRLKSK